MDEDELTPQEIFASQDAATPTRASTPAKTPKKGKGKMPVLSEDEVRRSLRIKKLHKGFKTSGAKRGKCCVGCSTNPPEISTSIIRDLRAAFCDINPEELIDESLMSKKAAKPISKKPAKKKEAKSFKKGGQ